MTRRCPSRRRQQRRSQSLVAPMPSKAYFLFSAMWGAHLHSLLAVLRRTAVAEKPAETVRERVARGAA